MHAAESLDHTLLSNGHKHIKDARTCRLACDHSANGIDNNTGLYFKFFRKVPHNFFGRFKSPGLDLLHAVSKLRQPVFEVRVFEYSFLKGLWVNGEFL